MTTPIICNNFINGAWVKATEGAILESRNPSDRREVVATFPRSSKIDVDSAVSSARQAYRSWRLIPAPARAEYIFHVGELNRAFAAMRDIEAGITYINGPTIGAEVHLPFGGVKSTGNGHREAGTAVLDVFTEWKTVYIDFSGNLQRAQIDNRT